VILASFRSEWRKLRRPTLFWSTIGGLAAAASMFVVLLFSQSQERGGGGVPSLVALAKPNGLMVGVGRASILLGIVAFGIAAAQVAQEYSQGTLRQLLVRQPRRSTLLFGKLLGVVSFLLIALVIASAAAFVVAVLAAHIRQVSVHAWFSGAGIGDLLRGLANLAIAVIGFSTLGFAVGQFVRSAVFAVIIGFAWLLPIEGIIIRIVPSAARVLPGSALDSLAEGGNGGVGYRLALIVGIVYLVVATLAALVDFSRRDVTA
jgi:ABC-type transport system involved in multi-copper enzyme maturation permease subunit